MPQPDINIRNLSSKKKKFEVNPGLIEVRSLTSTSQIVDMIEDLQKRLNKIEQMDKYKNTMPRD
jgi:hypothetical protein